MGLNAKDFLTQQGRKELLIKTIRNGKSAIAGAIKPQEVSNSDYGILSLYCENLTVKAKNGEIDPIIGRDAEVSQLVEILERRNKNNVLVVGDPGIGKSSIVQKLAVGIVNDQIPALKGFDILSLNAVKLIAGTKMRSDIENRLHKVLDKAAELSSKSILFIDDLQNIVNSDSGESIAMLLKTSLVRSISVTSSDIYKKSFEKDPSFIRRFHVLSVEAPSVEETKNILRGLAEKNSNFYKVEISEESISAAATLSDRYVNGRHLPDKAIDLLEQAASNLKLELNKNPETKPVLDRNHVAEVIFKWTGIPVSKMMESEKEKLRTMEIILNGKVIGQGRAVETVANAVRRSRLGIGDPKKPVGSFLFLGPTGVGKTELAKALAEFLFDSPEAMHRFDMSEFGEKHTVARMLGAPPGYAGHDQGGQLTDPIRNNPYSVVLFDEIEKAHPDVWNIWLQILDEGRLTDQQQRLVDFRNTVVMMTSNIGARYTLEDWPEEKIKDKVMEEVRKHFKPELLNRIDDIVVFNKLNRAGIRKIVDLQLKSFIRRFEDKDIKFDITDSARDWLANVGYDPAYGARPLKRAIQANLENVVASDLMNGKYGAGDTISVDSFSDELQFSKS